MATATATPRRAIESGVPDNKHFGDLLEDWRNGKTRLLPFSQPEVDAAKESESILKP